MNFFAFFLFTIANALCDLTTTDVLQVVESSAKLRGGKRSVAAVYDEDDTIYIFGGYNGSPNRHIDKYSISEDTIIPAGEMTFANSNGNAVFDEDGGVLYLGGDFSSSNQKFHPVNFSVTPAGILNLFDFGLIQTESRAWLVYGGTVRSTGNPNQAIHLWDMNTLSLNQIGVLSSPAVGKAATVFSPSTNKIYYLHNHNNVGVNIVVHDLKLNTTETLPEIISSGFHFGGVRGVYDGTNVYLLGNMKSHQNASIVKYNVEAHTAEHIPVIDYPGVFDQGLHYTEPLFVSKLNRIYFFGGFTKDPERYYDGIWYIDLSTDTTTSTASTTTAELSTEDTAETSTPSPAITTTPIPGQVFNCSHRLDGFFPHTLECDRYFGCQGGQAHEFTCPNPLLYNAETKGCAFPHLVDCDISCEGKDAGFHPHPYYCHLYIGCLQGERFLLECDPPLLFDPIRGNCNFPNMVECPADY